MNSLSLTPLDRRFYESGAETVARRLLGCMLVRQTPVGICGGIIVETEAYLQNDPASHSFRGLTPRNRSMFGQPGIAYVYRSYGVHWCFNVVCGSEGIGEAVLIRALEPTLREDIMRQNRPVTDDIALTSGPGRLCQALALSREHDGANLCDASSPIWIAAPENLKEAQTRLGPIIASPRIGIRLAADAPLRYYLAASRFLSRRATRPVPPQ